MATLKVTTETAATDIYRFASLRAVNATEKDAQQRRFVKFSLDQTQQKAFSADATLLLKKIPLLKKQPDSRKNTLADVANFFTNSPLKLMSVKDLFSTDNTILNYPDFHDVYLWLRENNSNKELKNTAALKKEIETVLSRSNILGKTISKFLGNTNATPDGYYTRKIALWENLVAYYYSPTNYPLIEEISKLIRWFWIMEKIDSQDPDFKTGQDIYEAANATIIFPGGISKLESQAPAPPSPAPATTTKEETKTPVEQPAATSSEDYGHQLMVLRNASKEISDAYKNQLLNRSYAEDYNSRKQESGISSLTLLSGRAVGNLDQNTHKVLNTLNIPKDILHVQDTLSAINEEKKIVYSKVLAAKPQSYSMLIGNSMVNKATLYTGGLTKLPFFNPPVIPPDPLKPGQPTPTTIGKNIRMGMADLKIIQTQLLKYALGEVAHIENVLLGETKTRTFRELNRTEQVFMTDTETTTDTQKDAQSTDRFELGQEISKIQKEDLKFNTGLNVTADLGTVKINATADFSYASSKEESNKIDSRSSKEIVNRAVSRITERKRTQSSITTLKETEDTSVHVFNNAPGVDNIAGVYNWVDKYYLAQVKNYGKHLMLDFIIPEPAAFYLFSKIHKKSVGLVKELPLPPMIYDLADDNFREIRSFHDIDETNYAALAAQYNAPVTLYPEFSKRYQKSFTSPAPAAGADGDNAPTTFVLKDETIKIEDGYEAQLAVAIYIFDYENQNNFLNGLLSHYYFGTELGVNKGDGTTQLTMYGETGNLALSIHAHTREFIVNIDVYAYITQKKIDEWKLQTFTAIMTAYQTKLTEYEEWLTQKEINTGVYIAGNNPDRNREIEKEELKKGCIELLTAQRFESFDAMRVDTGDPWNNYPEFSFPDADDEGKYIQFFEQLFLWNQMTYNFYPYFWGRRKNWVEAKSIEDNDPLFSKFLQAGAARVLVPLRLGEQYRSALQYFLDNGLPWNGGEAPMPDDTDRDSLWISVVDELKENMGQFETKGTMEGKPWIVKMPTDLVYLHSIKPTTKPALPDNSNIQAIQDLLEQVEDKSMLV